MKDFYIISYNHKYIPFEKLGSIHTSSENFIHVLPQLKQSIAVDELMLISTCNRVEFILKSAKKPCPFRLLQAYKPGLSNDEIGFIASNARLYENEKAVEYLFRVACSLESFVVGEREIITQIRDSYELSKQCNTTGDSIRLCIKQTIETAKKVFSETQIGKGHVSVVSLAFQKLLEKNPQVQSKILMIGAGATNTNMLRLLNKHGFFNITLLNRTLEKAALLAVEFSCKAYQLSEIDHLEDKFDVVISCLDLESPLFGEKFTIDKCNSGCIIIDLALPPNFTKEVSEMVNISYIHFNELKKVSEENLQQRKEEVSICEKIIEVQVKESLDIFKEREVELSLKDIPTMVREINEMAIKQVFAKDIEKLDDTSKAVIENLVAYLEKKYISLPIKKAKEIILEKI